MDFWDNMDKNKDREVGTPYNKNTTLIQFKRTMEREGKTVTTYTGGKEFKAFFRIREDNENQKEVITMYYDVTAPVRQGTLVMYGYGVFLALNRETVENDTYYKSALVKCNGVYNSINGYGAMNLPFYTDNMKSSVSIGNQTISMLNGNIEMITEENSLSKQIAINNDFNEFGRTFKITNRYVIDGMVHLIAEIEADKIPTYVYSIEIDGVPGTSVEVGSSVSLSATPYINGSVTTGATFEWESSNTDVATVDGIGNVTFIESGNVSIKCTWVEKSVTKSTSIINVTASDEPPTPTENWSINISGSTSFKISYQRSYTITTLLDGVEIHLTGVQYEILSANTKLKFAVNTFDETSGIIKLRVDDDNFAGTTFTLRVYHVDKGISAEMDITILESF